MLLGGGFPDALGQVEGQGAVVEGQAGATWLEDTVEMEEDWVLDDVVVTSSSPNGFFPQHTVVSMQFLNCGAPREQR